MIETAKISWKNLTPFNLQYKDIYYTEEGLAEAEYVFVTHNQLLQRWQHNAPFTIAETGFGTGLNFLCTAYHWLKNSAENDLLRYIAIEKYPLTSTDMLRALNNFQLIYPLAETLVSQLPEPIQGKHTIELFNQRVTLILIYDDVKNLLPYIHNKVDAWFFDGFAPSKNPSMWTPQMFKQIASLTENQGTFATFTAASQVRKELQQAGFSVEKAKGFGRKREMLKGILI